MAADLTITAADVAVVEKIETLTAPEAETLAAGVYARLNTSNGKLEKGNSSGASEARKGGLVIKREGDGMVTILRKGTVDLGDALSALAYDANVFLSNTDGVLNDTTSGTELIVGTVVPAHTSNTPDKLLRIDL